MTKKHFNDFAVEIKAMDDRKAAKLAAVMVANVAARHNANFNRTRFFIACGL